MDPDDNAPLMDPVPDSAPPDDDPAGRAATRAAWSGLLTAAAMAGLAASVPHDLFPYTLVMFVVGFCFGTYAIVQSLYALFGRTAGKRRPVDVALVGLLLGMLPWAFIAWPVIQAHNHPYYISQSRSSSNIRQLAIAITAYTQDNDGAFPGWVKNPDGRYVHDVWDEQINPNVKSRDVFNNNFDIGIASPSQPAPRDRVLTYGFNGLLLAPSNAILDPHWDRASVRPRPWRTKDISDPARTILLAELDTEDVGRWPGYATPAVLPFTRDRGHGDAAASWWKEAIGAAGGGGTIDISPRSWVEVAGYGNPDNYRAPYRHAAGKGVARHFRRYRREGANYAFCDGHVQFLRVEQTVGMADQNGQPTSLTPQTAWAPGNKANMWVPR